MKKDVKKLKQDCEAAGLPVVRVWYDELDILQAEFVRSLTAEEWQTFVDLRDGATYKEKRAREYPPLGEFADAFYWLQKGDNKPMVDYLAKCDAVKAMFPKE